MPLRMAAQAAGSHPCALPIRPVCLLLALASLLEMLHPHRRQGHRGGRMPITKPIQPRPEFLHVGFKVGQVGNLPADW